MTSDVPRESGASAALPADGVPAPLPPGPRKVARVYLAPYERRVGAALLDGLVEIWPVVLGYIAMGILLSNADPDPYPRSGGSVTTLLALAAVLAGWTGTVGMQIWNRVVRQGRTGQSVGKKALGIAVVRVDGRRVMGPGLAFGRYLAHILDAWSVIGYLWPLWDAKKQTFADMICGTIVRHVERPRPSQPRVR